MVSNISFPAKVKPDCNLAVLRGASTIKQSVLLPHDLVHSIFEFDEAMFRYLFVGPSGASWMKFASAVRRSLGHSGLLA